MKTRIRKIGGRWAVTRPAFGFSRDTATRWFDTFADAAGSLDSSRTPPGGSLFTGHAVAEHGSSLGLNRLGIVR